jgi:hypothetical protein
MTGTQQQAGFWEGLIFFSSNVQNELNHVIIEYAGSEKNTFIGEAAAVAVSNGDRVALSNVTIRNSGEYGLRAEPRAQLPNFANNTFENNDTPLSIPTRLMGALDGASSYSGNTNDYVEVYAENVVEDMTVVALDVPYRLSGDPAITDNSLVIVEAGVAMQFGADASLVINGNGSALAVRGTSDDLITMTGVQQQAGFWEGLIFFSSNVQNELNHVIIEYAGSEKNTFIGEAAAVAVSNGDRVALSNVTIRNSGEYGLRAEPRAQLPNFANNTFENNDTPLSIPTRLMGALDGASSYSGNTNDYVEVYAENVVEDMTVVALDVPYRLNGDPAITDDAFMQIEAGVTLQFTAGSSIIVNNLAALAAIGTSSNRITMTGTQNPDNGGFWEGLIFLTSDTRNELNNVDILYGGVEKNTFIGEAANVGVGRRSRLTIENCLLDFSGGYGGWANDGTNANVTFSNNTYGGSNDEGSNNWGE